MVKCKLGGDVYDKTKHMKIRMRYIMDDIVLISRVTG